MVIIVGWNWYDVVAPLEETSVHQFPLTDVVVVDQVFCEIDVVQRRGVRTDDHFTVGVDLGGLKREVLAFG